MKLGILSDIHVDINQTGPEELVIPAMADYARQCHLDAWLIAGDMASDYRLTLLSLDSLEELSGRPCFFVPGNHDLWTENHRDLSSWEILDRIRKHRCTVSGKTIRLKEGWNLVGETGWYDFSFGDPAYSTDDFNRMIYREGTPEERIWQDSIMAVWKRPAADVHAWFLEALESRLASVPEGRTVVMTHVLPVEDFTVHQEHPRYEMWRYLNAFLGGKSYGELLYRHPHVEVSICGHIHYRKEAFHRNIRFFCSCLGYTTEWEHPEDPGREIADAAAVLDI